MRSGGGPCRISAVSGRSDALQLFGRWFLRRFEASFDAVRGPGRLGHAAHAPEEQAPEDDVEEGRDDEEDHGGELGRLSVVFPVERRVDVAVVFAVLQAAGEVDVGPQAVQERVGQEEQAVHQVHGLVAHRLVEHHQHKIDAVRPGRDRVDLAAVVDQAPVQHEDEEGRRQGDALQDPGRAAVPRRPLRRVLRAFDVPVVKRLGGGGEGQS